MTGDLVALIAYAAVTAIGVFAAVLALLRLRRENMDLRERLRAYETRQADSLHPTGGSTRNDGEAGFGSASGGPGDIGR